VFNRLQEDKNVRKITWSNHILNNATKHASAGLDVDFATSLKDIWTLFDISKKIRV
jgi:hypothetical protein